MIDKAKQYRTRDGRQVEIVCTDLSGHWSVLAIITNQDGSRDSETYSKDGNVGFISGCPLDLIEVKPRIKRTYWANVPPDSAACVMWNTKEQALKYSDNRIACVPITIDCEEGEGLVEGK